MIRWLIIGVMLFVSVAAWGAGMIQFVNNTIPPGGYLLDGSSGFLYDQIAPERLLSR